MRGATRFTSMWWATLYFNPRSSCEERLSVSTHIPPTRQISIHAPHARSDGYTPVEATKEMIFQSTLLMRGATLTSATGVDICSYFNPRSSCEERPARRLGDRAIALFQSTLLMRGATRSPSRSALTIRFQSTLLMRGATKQAIYLVTTAGFQSTLLMRGATSFLLSAPASESISIHAPHARSDHQAAGLAVPPVAISIHAPHARSDVAVAGDIMLDLISIHAPHARSDKQKRPRSPCSRISIHAPHARSDKLSSVYIRSPIRFQSTLLMRGATAARLEATHRDTYFNPRSSCEERQSSPAHCHAARHFNPRSSCEERPPHFFFRSSIFSNFNPRSSCEERQTLFLCRNHSDKISIHAPHARSDYLTDFPQLLIEYFNPRSSCEERLQLLCTQCLLVVFQSTLLMRGATTYQ